MMASRKYSLLVFGFVALVLLFPFMAAQIGFATNLRLYDDNSWTMYGLFRYRDPSLFVQDYAAEYYLSFWTPWGFKLLHYVWSCFADALILHRALPLLLWTACMPLVFFTARRLGGAVNAWVTLALFCGSGVYLSRMAAAMPHSFALFLMWWAVAAVVSGRVWSLAVCTVVSACIYPIVTPMAGMMLAVVVLFPKWLPHVPRGSAVMRLGIGRKLSFVAMVACLAAVFISPMILKARSGEYGRGIDAFTEQAEFPEVVLQPSPPPLTMVLMLYMADYKAKLGHNGSVIMLGVLLLVLLVGEGLRDKRDDRISSLMPFFVSAGFWCGFSWVFAYDHAYRFMTYSLPIAVTLFLPLCLRNISQRFFGAGMQMPAFLMMSLAMLSLTAKADAAASGYMFAFEDYQMKAFDFIGTLPKDAMVAGWPGVENGKIAEGIPFLARRKTLVAWESHARVHKDYTLEMRRRMFALEEAYLAADVSPLLRLRDEFGVDYLVVNDADFTGAEVPKYFEPFDTLSHQLWVDNAGKFIVPELVKQHSVYDDGGIHIIDLHTL